MSEVKLSDRFNNKRIPVSGRDNGAVGYDMFLESALFHEVYNALRLSESPSVAEGAIDDLLERHQGVMTKAEYTAASREIHALLDASVRAEREKVAAWHDQRARDTPDAFEMEFHQVCAAAIRNRKE